MWSDDIAVIGIGCRFPGAAGYREFWKNLSEGKESIAGFRREDVNDLPPGHPAFADQYVYKAPMLEGIELFDHDFFGFSPKEAKMTDPQLRLLLECAWNAIEDAGYCPQKLDTCGVYMSGMTSMYYTGNILSHQEINHLIYQSHEFNQNCIDYLSTAIAYKLDLKGPALTVQSYCSSSLLAVHLARQSLLMGDCNVALAGGASVKVPQTQGHVYSPNNVYSPDGHCRVFDEAARGTIFGSGVGVVVLKRLKDAVRDNDSIYGVIKTTAVNNDGGRGKLSFFSPLVDGQARVIRAAVESSAVDPERIGYIEAHGTATEVGDRIELNGLSKAFKPLTGKKNFCAIGSLKSNIGHLEAASGIAAFIKVLLSLKHRKLVPSINLTRPTRKFDFGSSQFYLNTELKDWESPDGKPLVAGVNSFGYGGTNVHAIVEEYPDARGGAAERDGPVLLTFSGRSAAAAAEAGTQLQAWLGDNPAAALSDVGYTLNTGRRHFPYRNFYVVTGQPATRPGNPVPVPATEGPRTVVFLFPGQGSGHLGMAADLYAKCPPYRGYFDACALHLKEWIGADIRELLYPAQADEAARRLVERTELAQPLLFAVSYALAKLWMHWGIKPYALVGHSMGELVAACIAGVMGLEDALWLVVQRGRLMQQLDRGAMLSVHLSKEAAARYVTPDLALAAINGKELVVFSGPDQAIEALRSRLHAANVNYQPLTTARAFHSPMMDPVLPALREKIASVALRPPQLPVVSTVTGDWLTPARATDPQHWVDNARQSVRFGEALETLAGKENLVFLEVGPGRVLSTFAKAAGYESVFASLPHPRETTSPYAHCLGALGALWATGVPVNWNAFYGAEKRKRVHLPTYPFERKRAWIERRTQPEYRQAPPAGPPGALQITRQAAVGEWLYAPFWRQLPGDNARAFEAGTPFVLFHDPGGVAAALQARLAEKGYRAIGVRPGNGFRRVDDNLFEADIARPADYQRLFGELAAGAAQPLVVVHCCSLDGPGQPPADDEVLTRGYYSLTGLAQALNEHRFTDVYLHVVGNRVFNVAGNEPVHPLKSSVLGPVKSIPQELPFGRCRYIDLGDGAAALRRLPEEVILRSDRPVVSLRGTHKWVQENEPLRAEPARRPDFDGKTFLVIGGLGAIGYSVASYLSGFACNLVVTFRSGIPPRAQWDLVVPGDPAFAKIEKIRKLERNGATVLAESMDVNSREQVSHLKDKLYGRFGGVHGIIHAAGVFGADAFVNVENVTPGSLEKYMRTKMPGLHHISEVFGPSDAGFCAVVSSLSSVLGGIGYGQYAATHLVLDAFVRERNETSSFPWMCYNLDEWETAEERGPGRTGREQGVRGLAISHEEGVDLWGRLLAMPGVPQAYVSTADLQKRMDQWLTFKNSGDGSTSAGPVVKAGDVPAEPTVKEFLLQTWAQLLGLSDVSEHDNFIELGGHSLIAVSMLGKIRKKYSKARLSLMHIIENPTVGELTREINRYYPEGEH